MMAEAPMSTELEYPLPSGKSSLPAALIGAAVHTGLWVLLFVGVSGSLIEHQRTFGELHVQLPQATRWAFMIGRLIALEPILVAMALAVLLAVDVFLLNRLGRGGYRVLREVWSAAMVVLPVATLGAVASAVLLAHDKLTQAMFRPAAAHAMAERAELDRLSGQWKLVALERDGSPAAVPTVTLTLDGTQVTWDAGEATWSGTIHLILTRNPPALSLWQSTGPDRGAVRHGLFKLKANRLEMCIGQPHALGENLPADFTTRGTANELLTFSRVE